METLISNLFLHNWQKKGIALALAMVIWFFVSHSIMETKVVPAVPIRIVNIPDDSTVLGLLPNGVLQKRITLTVTGTKDVVDRLEPGDIEVVVDGSLIDHSDWVLRIGKNNLVSLDPSIDLTPHVSSIAHSEYVIKLRPLITAEIPITILHPKGYPPNGYELLDIWPQNLMQTYSGAESEIQEIRVKGLNLQFDLSRIGKPELDALTHTANGEFQDEITFPVPSNWKKVTIPCTINEVEEINDPDADDLQINFLRQRAIALPDNLPIRVFYPTESIDTLNPESAPLATNGQITEKDGLFFFTPKVYLQNVTQEFIDAVKDHIEIVITASSDPATPFLWSVDLINRHHLENSYVAKLLDRYPKHLNHDLKDREVLYRNRFQDYAEKLSLYTASRTPLQLDISMKHGTIIVKSLNS